MKITFELFDLIYRFHKSDLLVILIWKNSEKIKSNLIPDKMEGTLHTLTERFSVCISVNHCYINVSCKSDSINLFSNSEIICDQINLFSNCILL